MENVNWQLVVVLICVAGALWSIIVRIKKLMAGHGGCGDCSKANSVAVDSDDPKLVSEDQIEMLYETKE